MCVDIGVNVSPWESKDLGSKPDVGDPFVMHHRLDGALADREPPCALRLGFVVWGSKTALNVRFRPVLFFDVHCASNSLLRVAARSRRDKCELNGRTNSPDGLRHPNQRKSSVD